MADPTQYSVACCLWGGWCAPHGVEYVNRLYRAVERNLSLPHRFFCFTDQEPEGFAKGITVQPIQVLRPELQIGKLYVHRQDNGLTGRVLVLDLDTLIVGPLDDLLTIQRPFICRHAFHRRQKEVAGGIGGDALAFDAGSTDYIWRAVAEWPDRIVVLTGGDERIIYKHVVGTEHVDFWQTLLPGCYQRFKDFRRHPDPRARLVSCYGKWKPHLRDEETIRRFWR